MSEHYQICQYKIISTIGSGAYSTVYKAQHVRTGRYVALKKIKKPETTNLTGFPKNVLQEYYIQSQLCKQYFPEVLDFVYDPESQFESYIVFEYFPYDLASIIHVQKGKVISHPNHLACYFRQMLFSLFALHSRKIVHRDIKPSNFVINSDNIIKLADFGLSRQIDLTGESKRKLTPNLFTNYYRPPEMLLGGIKYGYEVDIWALGITFLEFLISNAWFRTDYRDTIFEDNATGHMKQLIYIFERWGPPSAYEWNPEETDPYVSDVWKAVNQQLNQNPLFQGPRGNQSRLHDWLSNIIPREYSQFGFIELLEGMLDLNPRRRKTIPELLKFG